MRTYGLVCMASTAITVVLGDGPLWYGGMAAPVRDGGDCAEAADTGGFHDLATQKR